MLESLRARLLVWQSAILLFVVLVFSGTVCYFVWRARLVDIDATLTARAALLAQSVQRVGPGIFDLTIAPDAGDGTGVSGYGLWTAEGVLIDRSDPTLPQPSREDLGLATRNRLRQTVTRTRDGVIVAVVRDLEDVRTEIWRLAFTLFGVGASVVGFSMAGGWWSARRALMPLERIDRAARRMSDGDLSARIPVERVETELGQVARTLNEAFDQLHASLARQRRLTADVSHELRTPLATLSTEVQWALGRPRSEGAYRESLVVCQRAAARMLAIVEQLLGVARDEATTEPASTIVRLDEIVQSTVDDLAPLANQRELFVTVRTQPLSITADPGRLREALTNVVANAIRYNVDRGRIDVRMIRQDDGVDVIVEDTGVGISENDLPKIFDPFFRADPARKRDAGGAGLGLAVTRAIVERHHGVISCTSIPGHGTTVSMRLPISPPLQVPTDAKTLLARGPRR
jgi:heavy metal sensor kinase